MQLTTVQQAGKQAALNRFKTTGNITLGQNSKSKKDSIRPVRDQVASATTGFRASE